MWQCPCRIVPMRNRCIRTITVRDVDRVSTDMAVGLTRSSKRKDEDGSCSSRPRKVAARRRGDAATVRLDNQPGVGGAKADLRPIYREDGGQRPLRDRWSGERSRCHSA
jgi:hypothetical protein